MSRRRLVSLVLGVVLLSALTVWRLSREGQPEAPSLGGPPEERTTKVTPHPATSAEVSAFSGQTMGTTFSVKYRAPQIPSPAIAMTAVENALALVDESMSTYRPDSEVTLLNLEREGVFRPVSPEFLQVLTLSEKIHRLTGGAFDITVGPLVRAYGFGARALPSVPAQEELERLRSLVGMEHLVIETAPARVKKTKAGTEVDLSAVAKGFAVDQAAEALIRLGIANFMVEVGGEIRVLGVKSAGQPWTLGIEKPTPEERALYLTVSLPEPGGALATSGDYRNFRKVGEQMISHTFDPRTGAPVPRRTASVSVVRPTAAEADALATGLGVLEPQRALKLASEQGWAVLLLVHKSGVHKSGGDFEVLKSAEFAKLEARH